MSRDVNTWGRGGGYLKMDFKYVVQNRVLLQVYHEIRDPCKAANVLSASVFHGVN